MMHDAGQNDVGERPCQRCGPQIKLTRKSLERGLADYLREHDEAVVNESVYALRLAECMRCAHLLYGCTCGHCGCLVQIRAKLAGKTCPCPA
ncbi:MAG TPA: DUF6171 family protein, partial [Sedimentisphaerales bacterium]|nr:DUF6171 family protein [Sedimentisphaerales bacterium]